MDDRHIIRLLFSRAEQAIEALADAYGKRLYGIARNILGSTRDAEECVNDTYLALWNAIPPEEPDPLCAYAYRVGRNIALKRLRSNTAAIRCADYVVDIGPGAGVAGGEVVDELLGVDALFLGLGAHPLRHAPDVEAVEFDGQLAVDRRGLHFHGDLVVEGLFELVVESHAARICVSR